MKIHKTLCFLLVIFSTSFSFADHLAGGYFEYSYQGSGNYEIDYYFLRDCDGAAADNPHLYMMNDCGYSCADLGEMYQVGTSDIVDYGCGNTCLFGTGGKPGYRIIHFQKTISFPSVCNSWTLSVDIDVRNIVDYVDQGNGYPYYNYCKINNTVTNNSPDVSGNPVVLGCVGWNAKTLFSVAQTDGDQVVYDLVPSKIAEGYNGGAGPCAHHDITYVTNLSASQTFPSTAPFNLDQSNGSFDFRATMTGKSYFAVRAREYRNNVLIGEIVVDGMIVVESCIGAGDVTFHSFQSSGNNIMNIPATPGNYCQTVKLTADESIDEIVVDAPSFVTWSVNNISSEEADVTICVNTAGMEYTCDSKSWGFTINAHSKNSDDCFSSAGGYPDKGYYSIYKQAGDYCPANLYLTNRNPQSGIPMPLHAHAEERIWIGDNMPPIYDPNSDGPVGPVLINGDAEYIAGTEIILPSCQTGNGCVTLSGNLTIKIAPNTCSAECPQEPFDVYVHEYFECSKERLEVVANGTAPFTYQLILLGDTTIQDQAGFNIHNVISQQDNGQVPYKVIVYDAAGISGTFNGNILGTKRFYEHIVDNKIYFYYPDTIHYWEDGYYYAGNMGVYSTLPAYWTDSVNTSPPWYGATHMRLEIWDRWGNSVNYMDHDLEVQPDGTGGEDWSLNQGEFWWNGKQGNNIWGDCYENFNNLFFNYVLKARNCYDDENIDMFVADVDEASVVALFACTNDDPWHPVEEKSTGINGDDNNDYAQYQKFTGTSRFPEIIIENPNTTSFALVPNPANDWVELVGTFDEVSDFIIVDQAGKKVLQKSTVSKDQRIDVSSLTSGVYTVHCKTTGGTLQYKLIII